MVSRDLPLTTEQLWQVPELNSQSSSNRSLTLLRVEVDEDRYGKPHPELSVVFQSVFL